MSVLVAPLTGLPVAPAVLRCWTELRERDQEGAGRHRGKELGARLADNGARGHEVLEELLDVLVVDVELLFERIQFRIVVDLPPFAAQRGILGLGDRPAAQAAEGRVGRGLPEALGASAGAFAGDSL